jgi:hypothetical protein
MISHALKSNERESFMLRKWKRFAMTVVSVMVVACMLFPLAVSASNVATAASVVGFSAQNTAITIGQTVTISVTTNAAATHVFAELDGVRASNGVPQSTDASGNVTWNLTVAPTRTQMVQIYANTSDSTAGAVNLSIQVTVAGSAEAVALPGAVASTTGVEINSIVESVGNTAGTVVLTVETNATANDVWVQFDGTPGKFSRARMENDTGAIKTWTLTFRPNGLQTVTVNANTAYVVRGAASQPFAVTFSATPAAGEAAVTPVTTGGGRATISNVRSNRSDLVTNESMTLTITTNLHATNVWVRVDDRDVAARLSRTTRASQTWTVTFTPARSQTMTVYANSADTTDGAVTRTHRVTVNERRLDNARVRSAVASNTHINSGWATITIETNSSANHVWVEFGGLRRNASLVADNINTLGDRRWTVHIDWADWVNQNNPSVRAHAGETSNVSNHHLTVEMGNWTWGHHGNLLLTGPFNIGGTHYRIQYNLPANVAWVELRSGNQLISLWQESSWSPSYTRDIPIADFLLGTHNYTLHAFTHNHQQIGISNSVTITNQ